MASTADAMLAQAAKDADAGYKEGKSNDTKFGRWYPMNYQPWCDMAVSKWAEDSGNADIVGKFAYCPSHVNWFKARGQWHDRGAAVRRGDIVFFSWDGGPLADHVGVVTADAAAGADVHTIEGNTSSGNAGSQGNGDGVYRRTRGRGVILGFGRPSYKVAPKPAAKYEPFPGVDYFKKNPRSSVITRMGERLVAEGYGGYAKGPGPQWTDADRRAFAWWQKVYSAKNHLGWSGSDVDGWPGKASWDALKVPKG
ncbi:peptidoglycan-binding protein [Streptomyces sp. NRRL S-31]|uniref:peptidoglycan-binding protein n=1 Tax=Streptomyces sp. NRRL S-31 TaxID=1463898 RepID=UPI00131BFC47|nr:peptidoglycan-binding protein [Streptomyces sp. NRRL S-31]